MNELDEDDGYREWSETIEKQNQEQQEAEMAQFDTWEEFLSALHDPGSEFLRNLKGHLK